MLMKSSTKYFNHINCQQSRIHTPILCQARPEGQSLMTKEQSLILRSNGALSRLSKGRQLERRLNKDLSIVSQSTMRAARLSICGSIRGADFSHSMRKMPVRSARRLTARMTKSKSNQAKSIQESSAFK